MTYAHDNIIKMSQIYSNNQVMDFINNNNIRFNMAINNTEVITLRIRIPEVKDEDFIDCEVSSCDDEEIESPDPKRRKIDNDDNSKVRRNMACSWLNKFIMGFIIFMIMLPETLADDKIILDEKILSNWIILIVCVTSSVTMFNNILDSETKNGITCYSNFMLILAVVLPAFVMALTLQP